MGKNVKGRVDAPNSGQVAARLNSQGIAPRSIVEAPNATISGLVYSPLASAASAG